MGGAKVYVQSNKDLDLSSLLLLDPESGKTELVESDPQGKADLGGALFSQATDELVETWYIRDRVKNYFRDKAYEADVRRLERKFPGLDVSVVSRSLDEGRWLVLASGDKEPGRVLLYDRKTRNP